MEHILEEKLEKLGIQINDIQRKQFDDFYQLLIEWNKVMNLTGITEYGEVVEKHFVDSLSLVEVLNIEKVNYVIDVGTGAGFPGIPLKIAFPHLRITLLDSLNKRIKFLDTIIKELGLKDIYTIHGRAEDFARQAEYREKYDLCVSRAVANLATLSEYCLPYVRVNGFFISFINRLIYRFCIAKTIHQKDNFCFFYFLFFVHCFFGIFYLCFSWFSIGFFYCL